ncbi:MAG: hypothetical protein A2758_00275 [Candidatus Zambryskibacteria bacterium RIFCSPHIGHO2_01_FULL_49_18]|uniref:HIT domain-containing protein n=2 Tax=Candidatus Zambryskiibacteriota TaxID=1817925 RepID=A0A1G2T4M1_9BACT|nr:MAG: hypothetical protein A2758_00275 [Candidatus Zambryskibacteria bacterium RIFCSPHIGHO2_01_FULL_49_18]OHB05681.1 MAG: hypothetical protein A3A26_02255 [Candidatus Zambryskibacteria bacterium RIFCSPLOWO2_01_FULL_47_14]
MKNAKMRKDNARTPEQLARMRHLGKSIGCFFCNSNYLKVGASSAIRDGRHWYVKRNDYPYQGSVHHYLIASKKHIAKITNVSAPAWKELLETVRWIERKFKIRGESIFVRSGDMRYTGATLDHLHFHFLVGGLKKKTGTLEDNILVTLGHKSNQRPRS